MVFKTTRFNRSRIPPRGISISYTAAGSGNFIPKTLSGLPPSGLPNPKEENSSLTSFCERSPGELGRGFALRHKSKFPRMKFHHFGEMRQEISEAVVARVRVILVWHAFVPEFVV